MLAPPGKEPKKDSLATTRSSTPVRTLTPHVAAVAEPAPTSTRPAGYFSDRLQVGPPDDPRERAAERIADALTAPSGVSVSSTASVSPSTMSAGDSASLPADLRRRFETRLGADLTPVRVHSGAGAAAAVRAVNANAAFASGSDIVLGEAAPPLNTPAGERLLAHEVAHTLEPDADLTVRRDAPAQEGPIPQTDAGAAGAVPADAAVAAKGVPPGAQTGRPVVALDQASKAALSKSGLFASADEQAELAQGFPGGFTIGPPSPMVLSLDFGNRLDGIRVEVFRLTAAEIPQPGVEAWFFQLDAKGRSVLLSSIGGGSVLLDAGVGQTTSLNAPSVQRLSAAIGAVTAGPAAVPLTIKLSHNDADHDNTARVLLGRAGFADTAVEVTRQQVEGAGGWTRTSLTVQPTQRLIEIDVVGAGGVHVQRTVIDNMELIEYRSVAAHADLGRTDKVTFNRNRTSPVVVVRDLNTGARMLFTADAEGRQFDEIVNAVGETGMRRLLGAEGRNLKLMEAPHHFGAQAGPDARGMINMLQLAYESGDGSLRLLAQTTENFATKSSSTYNFLDASGAAPERVEGDPSAPGEVQATRAQGSTLARVTVDLTGVQQAIQALQARDTPLREAGARLADLEAMQSRLTAIRIGLGEAAPEAITAALTTSEADVARMRNHLDEGRRTVFDAMRAAAAPEGMRGAVEMTAVNAALTELASRVSATEADATRVGNGIGTLTESLGVFARLATNSVRIIQALEADNVTELYAARAEHTDLVRAARAQLGGSVVDAHIELARKAMLAEWPMERFEARTAEMSAQVASRERSAEFQKALGEGLARQLELNSIVAAAEHAGRQVYGPNGVPMTPASTRFGAGALAAIEVIRIGLDLANQWKAGSEAAELRQARTAYQGIAIMNWWRRLGVTPTLALAEAGIWHTNKLDIVLRDPQDKVMQAATSETPIEGVPAFTAVVVNGLDGEELRRLVHRAIAELSTLEDWHAFNSGFPGGRAFQLFDGFVWGVRVFLEDEGTYGYVPVEAVAPGLNLDLIRLRGELVRAQEDVFSAAKAAGMPAYGVKDTAWIFGQDRRVWTYSRRGNPVRLDFDSDRPRFQKLGVVSYPWRVDGPMVKVKAADVMTYASLADTFWIETNGSRYADETYDHASVDFAPNVHGYAYVDPDHLIPRDD